MFTIEHETAFTKVVVVDETAKHEDIEMVIEQNGKVFLRQFDEKNNQYDILMMSCHQFVDLIASIVSWKGMYDTDIQPVKKSLAKRPTPK